VVRRKKLIASWLRVCCVEKTNEGENGRVRGFIGCRYRKEKELLMF
jgi:hypothetical protein